MKISLLHPFTAKSIGFDEAHLYDSHSVPQIKALEMIVNKHPSLKIIVEYFTGKKKVYSCFNRLTKVFYPISNTKKFGVWKAEVSYLHYIKTLLICPDVTIINTSAHGGKYAFKIAKLIAFRKKKVFAMLGGINMDLRPSLKQYYSKVNLIITHTYLQKKQLLENSFFRNLPIEVLPLGVDTHIFKPSFKKKIPNSIELLFVGRITSLKRIEIVIHTLDKVKINLINQNVSLKIIGPVSDKMYKDRLLKLILELNLFKHVFFIDNITQHKLVYHYQSADLLLLPSKHESFGMVITEAMACGTPVIAMQNSGGPEEVIDHDKNGLICSIDSFSEDVCALLKDEKKLKSFSENAVKAVENKWSQEITATLFLSFLKKY